MNERTVHAVCFDLDDTLWDIMPAIQRAEEVVAKWIADRLGESVAQVFTNEERYKSMRTEVHNEHTELLKACRLKEVRRAIIKEGLTRGGYTKDDLEPIVDEALGHYLRMRSTLDLFPSCIEMLDELSERYTLGAITNGNADLDLVGIQKYFSCHVAAFHPGMKPKPHFDMFHEASNVLDTPLHSIIMVGDSIANDIEPALALGMRAVYVDVKSPNTVTPPLGVPSVSHLRDLPGVIETLVKQNPPGV
eukprot:TRINITY_DN5499_c0_g1_i1.p1 TRINITY_DN5499_c0_g1~~TRINITY_DN5499_c0_g1_i1.p1  ORF type:complete len:248 (+),score=53.61 TRINITY_DN5499_c0_g1_i1:80-823(+)